jgi:hypothetical protein
MKLSIVTTLLGGLFVWIKLLEMFWQSYQLIVVNYAASFHASSILMLQEAVVDSSLSMATISTDQAVENKLNGRRND